MRLKLLFLFVLATLTAPLSALANELLDELFTKNHQVLLLIDPATGQIIKGNGAAEQFYGYSADQLSQMKIQDINQFDSKRVREEMELAKSEGRNFFVFQHKLANGDIKTVEVYSVPLTVDDRILLFSTIHDITSLRKAEEGLWHYQSRLEQMVNEKTAEVEAHASRIVGLGLIVAIGFTLLSILLIILLLKNRSVAQRSAHGERRLKEIIWGTNVGTWEWNVKTGETTFSEEWAEIIGYTLEEISPTNIETWMSFAHPDDLEKSSQLLQQHFSGESDRYECEARMRHKNGHWIWVLDRGKVVEWDDDGQPLRMSGTHQEITKEKEFQKALEESERRFKDFANASSDWFWETDEQFRLTFLSDQFLNATGQHPSTIFGRKRSELVAPEELEREGDKWADHIADLEAHREFRNFEYTLRPMQGIPATPISISGVPVFDANGEFCGYRGVGENISARIKARQELVAAKEAAERASTAKSEFLSSMSHELRTPMNSILGFAQTLLMRKSEPLTDKQKNAVHRITNSGEHLLELIDDVLNLAKIEAGKVELSIETISVEGVLIDAIELARPIASQNDIQLMDPSGCDMEIAVLADYTRLKQCILNLMSNAVKYNSPKGFVKIECTSPSEDHVRLSITDSGPGISQEDQKHLFVPFDRRGAEGSQVEGTGIGLTITRKLIEAMGGTVGVSSEPGKGSTFWLELPKGKPQDIRIVRKKEFNADETVEIAESADKLVLYVEDNPINVELMEVIIDEIEGLELISAHTAELGLSITASHNPDLILMDIHLPGMDGYEALAKLKECTETRDIPVFALTADAMPKEVERGLAAGFEGYITKPFKVHEVLKTISEIIK